MTTAIRSATDAALQLAAELRASVRQRAVGLEGAISRYDEANSDPAATAEEKAEAAAILMKVVRRTDDEHHARKSEAYGDFASVTQPGGKTA